MDEMQKLRRILLIRSEMGPIENLQVMIRTKGSIDRCWDAIKELVQE